MGERLGEKSVGASLGMKKESEGERLVSSGKHPSFFWAFFGLRWKLEGE